MERETETKLIPLTKMSPRYTTLQGQYLAFIYYYTRIHGSAPAETDMQAYFKVSPHDRNGLALGKRKEGLERFDMNLGSRSNP